VVALACQLPDGNLGCGVGALQLQVLMQLEPRRGKADEPEARQDSYVPRHEFANRTPLFYSPTAALPGAIL